MKKYTIISAMEQSPLSRWLSEHEKIVNSIGAEAAMLGGGTALQHLAALHACARGELHPDDAKMIGLWAVVGVLAPTLRREQTAWLLRRSVAKEGSHATR